MTDTAGADRLAIPESGAWTFKNDSVARNFDAHVREQLPWYDLATGLVTAVGRQFIPQDGIVYDVGASTGNVGRALAETLDKRKAHLIALEPSEQMAALYDAPGELRRIDVDAEQFINGADLIVCFLVLMFVPVAERGALIRRLRAALRPGGALLVFDKAVPAGGDVGSLCLRLTLGAKYEAGAPADEIIAKELSLAGVQRPLHPGELTDFHPVFRFGDFGGWIAEAGA